MRQPNPVLPACILGDRAQNSIYMTYIQGTVDAHTIIQGDNVKNRGPGHKGLGVADVI